jgi:hypothetical protein
MAVVACVSGLSLGCLSTSYTISRAELDRVASAPPDARAENVHLKQRIFLSATGEALRPDSVLVEVVQDARVVSVVTLEAARDLAIVRSGAAWIRDLVAGPPGHDEGPGARAKSGQAPAAMPSSESGATGPRPESTEQKNEEKKNEAKDDDTTKAIIVGAVILGGVFIATGLAVSEGQRFDGYVSADPAQPIHLRNTDGEIGWVPLNALTAAMLRGVNEGIVSGEEGRLVRLRRAPLDRAGITFTAELGAAGLNTFERDVSPGFLGRFALGWFPAQQVGLLAGAALGIGPKGQVSVGTEVTPLLELDVLPIAFAANHLGLYAEGGRLFGVERRPSLDERTVGSWMYGGGLLYQRELTTLLAFFVRGGVKVFPDPGPAVVAPQLTIGLAIY